MKKGIYRDLHAERLFLNIVIYAKHIYAIGGIESWLYYVCKRYNEGQITVLYDTADSGQLERLKKVVDVIQYTGQEFHCNKVIYVAPIYVEIDEIYNGARERYLINHVCYGEAENTEVFELPEFDGNFAVSDFCAESCKTKMLGDIVTLYNPIEIDKPGKVVKFITACRWSKDKGSEQMLKFAEMLQHAGIQFLWFILTDEEPENHHPNMIFMNPSLYISPLIQECDWGVQFTRIESFGLFPAECLSLGTPVIVTDLPVFKEIGINDTNAVFFDWDMKERDVSFVLNPPKVKFKPPSSDKLYKELLKWDSSKS